MTRLSPKRHSKEPEPTFDVAIWNHEGDVVRAYWGVSADEVDDIREEYADDPMHVVVVEER